jgi:hypothetical protein
MTTRVATHRVSNRRFPARARVICPASFSFSDSANMSTLSATPLTFKEALVWTAGISVPAALSTLIGGRIGLKRGARRDSSTRSATVGMAIGAALGAGLGTVAIAAAMATGA